MTWENAVQYLSLKYGLKSGLLFDDAVVEKSRTLSESAGNEKFKNFQNFVDDDARVRGTYKE